MSEDTHVDRRKLSDEDIQAIVRAFDDHKVHCRFANVEPNDLYETVQFAKNCNKALAEGKSTIMRGIINVLLFAIVGLLIAGGAVKIKKMIDP